MNRTIPESMNQLRLVDFVAFLDNAKLTEDQVSILRQAVSKADKRHLEGREVNGCREDTATTPH